MADEKVYQASPATCVKAARQAIKAALDELAKPLPDLGYVQVELIRARAWLPSHLENEWDETMATWLHRANGQLDRPASE
jgi:hypothetical protein